VTRRALEDIVSTATLGSYGVTGFSRGPLARLLAWLGVGQRGLVVRSDERMIEVELDITVALGVPVAEVARQVDSAVRYAIRRALDRDVGRIVIHVDGLRVQAAHPPEPAVAPGGGPVAIDAREVPDRGTDVA
jgi:uncharacterized alkaline shock family protein YloU